MSTDNPLRFGEPSAVQQAERARDTWRRAADAAALESKATGKTVAPVVRDVDLADAPAAPAAQPAKRARGGGR